MLSQETQSLSNLSVHIEDQKAKVTKDFEELITVLITLLQNRKLKLCTALDQQVVILKDNYAYYRAILATSYGYDQQKTVVSQDGVPAKIQSLNSMYVKQLKDDLSETKVTNQDHELTNKLMRMAEVIAKQSSLLPLINVQHEPDSDWLKMATNMIKLLLMSTS